MNAHLDMTIRDYFAATAMQGLTWAAVDIMGGEPAVYSHYPKQLAKLAYDIADAMLAEREKRHEGA